LSLAEGQNKGKMYLSIPMMSDQTASISQVAGIVLGDLRYYLDVIDPVAYQSPLELLSGVNDWTTHRHIIEFL
jgi:hypothetical protein